MTRITLLIALTLIFLGCSKTEPITIEDLYFLITHTNTTSTYNNFNMELYSHHLEAARKLENYRLITVKNDEDKINNENLKFIDTSLTDLGKSVITIINNKSGKSIKIPDGLSAQIQRMENIVANKHKLNLRQYIFLVYSPTGDVSAPGEDVFTLHKETIETVKSLFEKGYLGYEFYDDTFNGISSKNYRWWPSQKGIQFNAGLSDKTL